MGIIALKVLKIHQWFGGLLKPFKGYPKKFFGNLTLIITYS